MERILLVSSSIRDGRKSNRVALYFQKFITENKLAEVELADLDTLAFPLFEERLKFQQSPPENLLNFVKSFEAADGILIVTPEYNGGYPASLKNVIDVLNAEWLHKPVALCAVSAGAFGASQVLTSLVFLLWKLKALLTPASFQVAAVDSSFDETGKPTDEPGTNKRAEAFVKEFLWTIRAAKA